MVIKRASFSLLVLLLVPLSVAAQNHHSYPDNYQSLFGRSRGASTNQYRAVQPQQQYDALFSQPRQSRGAQRYSQFNQNGYGYNRNVCNGSYNSGNNDVENCRRWLLFRDGNDRTWSQARRTPWGSDSCEQVVWQANRGYAYSGGYNNSYYNNGGYRDDGYYRDDRSRSYRTPPFYHGGHGRQVRVHVSLRLLFTGGRGYRHNY